MNTDSTIQVRLDSKTKAEAGKVFEKLGIDISAGIKLFLNQVIRTKSIPFVARTENGFTPAQEARMLKELEYAKKHGKRYASAKELHDDILKS